ncbi:MAG: Ni/Fe-hydrogenase, b-type cytochrome subunit [Negativicutes bacterium]|nr:Ni/Fe-hydrogenase, b-type cytochrome subunit [Negativicutes bacterium]
MNDGHLKEYYVFSPFLRIFHWIMVGCITVLFFTGLYIGNPFFIGSQGVEPTFAIHERLSMQIIRMVHFSAAYVLVFAFILRVYGFIINKGDRLFPHFWTKQYYVDLIDTKLHYMFLRARHKPFLRNPLARASYVAVYLFIAIEALTGFAMYVMVNPNGWGAAFFGPVNHLLIDEYKVHLIHHYVAWAIILFAIVHVYMCARADFMDGEGEISSMFSGKKFLAHQPVDLGDIAHDTDTDNRAGHRQHSITG